MRTGAHAKAGRGERFDVLAVGIILAACALRLIAYAQGHALWLDEAMLALNVIPAELDELARPLPLYEQAAPLGFLLVSKVVGMLGGYSEHALRLLPFVAGLASAPLTYVITQRIIGRRSTALLATVLVGFSPLAVRYSVEFRHYGVELTATLVALLLWWAMQEGRCRGAYIPLLAVAGLLLITLSFTVIIVLFSAGVSLLWLNLTSADLRVARRYAGAYIVLAIWAAGFLIFYFSFTRPVTAAQLGVHADYFTPHYVGAAGSALDLLLLHQSIVGRTLSWFLFDHSIVPRAIRLPLILVSAGLCAVGLLTLWRRSRSFVVFVGSALLTLYGLSVASLFPLLPGRYVLFLLPLVAIAMAQGLSWTLDVTQRWLARHGRRTWPAAVLPFVVLGVTGASGCWAAATPQIQEIRPLVARVRSWPQGDLLVVYHFAQPAFDYYTRGEDVPYVGRVEHPSGTGAINRVGRNLDAYVASILDELRDADAAWILFSNVFRDEAERMLAAFRRVGTLQLAQQETGVALYRFERRPAHQERIDRPAAP